MLVLTNIILSFGGGDRSCFYSEGFYFILFEQSVGF